MSSEILYHVLLELPHLDHVLVVDGTVIERAITSITVRDNVRPATAELWSDICEAVYQLDAQLGDGITLFVHPVSRVEFASGEKRTMIPVEIHQPLSRVATVFYDCEEILK